MITRVVVKTGARDNSIQHDKSTGNYFASVKAQPKDGEANEAIIKLLSTELKVPKSSIRLRSGTKSKIKLFEF